jgi:hypothetical protein
MTDTESRKLEADIVKTMAHTMELGAETAKLNKETFCYPVALSTLGGSLSNLCPTAPPSIQDGCCC